MNRDKAAPSLRWMAAVAAAVIAVCGALIAVVAGAVGGAAAAGAAAAAVAVAVAATAWAAVAQRARLRRLQEEILLAFEAGFVGLPWRPVHTPRLLRPALEAMVGRVRAGSVLWQDAYEEVRSMDGHQLDAYTSIAEDMAAPISEVVRCAEALHRLAGDRLSRDAVEDLDVVVRNAHRLRDLFEEVARCADVVTGNVHLRWESVNLSAVVADVATGLRGAVGRKPVEIRVEGVESAAWIQGDPSAVARIVDNLAQNAVKYTNEGHVILRVRCDGERVAVEVEDTGLGIAPEDQARIFEAYRQVAQPHRRRAGAGLGLATARKLVEAHRGALTVRSVPGEGSAFTAVFPRGEAP